MIKITFRLANKKDLRLFDDIRNEKLHKLHLSRIKKQEQKKAEYFIVLQAKIPIGHVFINYNNQGCDYPVIEDLFVKEKSREQGIAKEILIFAENHVKQKGFPKVGLDVGVGEKWLRKFYEKMGYVVVSGPHTLTYILEDKENKKVVEKVYHLRKKI